MSFACSSNTATLFGEAAVRSLFTIGCFWVVLLAAAISAVSQTAPTSERMAATAMTRWHDSWETQSGRSEKWSYEQGVVLKGIESVWYNTGDGKYFKYIQRSIDRFVSDDGTIKTYQLEDYNIDNVLNGRILLLLYKVTGQEKYRKAAAHLREQLKSHPRTSEGGFWHKQIYPSQMWLDGLYMGEPFYAEYASTFHEAADFDDVARQFVLMDQHAGDAKTGLLYHGWDESKQQRWANPQTGLSPNFWGRSVGWYAMALVDTLDYFPKDHPKRRTLIVFLQNLAAAIAKYQDPKSGLWYQVLDKAGADGNYLEASASCMFVYALAKGVHEGYLPTSYLRVAQIGYQGILKQFVETDSAGQVNLTGTVSVAGLGGTPYRDGSYRYYLSEKVVTNDPKGIGAFLLASSEIENNPGRLLGEGPTVSLDYYFNSETKKDASGIVVPYHYKWEETPNSGFSFWRHVFRRLGAETDSLSQAPTAGNLKKTDIYIIVDPDTSDETPNPHYINEPDIKTISDWVSRGGVLVLMANDFPNTEFDHLNRLAKRFGIQFNKDSRNKVPRNDFRLGLITTPAANQIFKIAKRLYLKEICTLSVVPPARSIIEDGDDVIMAMAKVGKGTVFAVGDPWFYNEYVDGRKLPPEFDNYRAAQELSLWLIQQTRRIKR